MQVERYIAAALALFAKAAEGTPSLENAWRLAPNSVLDRAPTVSCAGRSPSIEVGIFDPKSDFLDAASQHWASAGQTEDFDSGSAAMQSGAQQQSQQQRIEACWDAEAAQEQLNSTAVAAPQHTAFVPTASNLQGQSPRAERYPQVMKAPYRV